MSSSPSAPQVAAAAEPAAAAVASAGAPAVASAVDASAAGTAARLDALRGPVPPRSHDARTIAALTVNPGCSRRAVLDAAGVDKRKLSERIGFPARYGQSPFAITRGIAFEKQVKADGCAALLALLRSSLGLEVPEHEYVDLGADPDRESPGAGAAADRPGRYERTRALFARVAAGEALLADHPLLRLDVGGRPAYVEPDVVALSARPAGASASAPARLYVAEVKSFAVIDGQADPAKVGAAATQAAVYVLALRRLFAAIGADPALVAEDVILVCPKDFANEPSAHVLDVRRQLAAVERQLARLPRIGALVAGLDPTVDFDLAVDPPAAQGEPGREHRTAAELAKSLATIEARYAPECVTNCEMAFHCRAEARAAGAADVLGRSVRDALGGVETIDEVLALADARTPGPGPAGGVGLSGSADGGGSAGAGGQGEAARLLRAASRAYGEALLVPPRAAEPDPSASAAAAAPRATAAGPSIPGQPTAGPQGAAPRTAGADPRATAG